VRAQGESPVALLMIDPQGRRVGFDATSGQLINELGEGASYTGPESEPQIIDVHEPLPGDYVLRAMGTATGPYTIRLQQLGEEGQTVSEIVQTGQASPGATFELAQANPLDIQIDIKPRRSPNVLRPRGHNTVPVAIISTATFNAYAATNRNSLRFGPTGTETAALFCKQKDANKDGVNDLICRFPVRPAGFTEEDLQGTLSGKLTDGTPISGVDWIHIVDNKDRLCDRKEAGKSICDDDDED
jgi:hypothetical protein